MISASISPSASLRAAKSIPPVSRLEHLFLMPVTCPQDRYTCRVSEAPSLAIALAREPKAVGKIGLRGGSRKAANTIQVSGDVDLAAELLWLRGSQPLIPTALYIVAA